MSAQSASTLSQEIEAARLQFFVALVEAAQAKHAFDKADAREIGAEAYEVLECANTAANYAFGECAKRLQELLLISGPLTLDHLLSAGTSK